MKTDMVRAAGVIAVLAIALGLGSGPAPRAAAQALAAPEFRPSERPAHEAAFLAQNEAAMTKMMDAMALKPTGDVDRDFVAMMEPHHQGAIDMAKALLLFGSNPQLKRLAQEIIVTQQEEIAAMRLAIGSPLPAPSPAPTQP